MSISLNGTNHRYDPRSASLTVLAAALLVCGGCGATGEAVPVEELAVNTSAITTTVGSWTDWSGTVTVTLYQCGWSTSQELPTATCTVPDTDALVGGGAEIQGEGSPGALLTASSPNQPYGFTQTWFAASKDHVDYYPHQLRAYALGLRVGTIPGSVLRSSMLLVKKINSPAQSHPTSQVEGVVPPNTYYIEVGGGAMTTYYGAGQLLTESEPIYQNVDGSDWWWASSKDHEISDPGYVTAYAIDLPRCPVGYSGCLMTTYAQTCSSGVASGYDTVMLTSGDIPAGWAMTSIGGSAKYTGWGRMLTDMIPTYPQGATIRSKDHDYASAGYTCATIQLIQKAR